MTDNTPVERKRPRRGEITDKSKVIPANYPIPEVFTVEDVRERLHIPDPKPGPGRPRSVLNYEVIARVLNNIAATGQMQHSAVAAGISSQHWQKICTVNKEAMQPLKDEAMEFYRERVQWAIHSRAIDGWLEPVFWNGQKIGSIRRFSDRLLLAQAKRFIPEYKENNQQAQTTNNIGVLVVQQPAVTAEQWQKRHLEIVKTQVPEIAPSEPEFRNPDE